MVVDAAEDLDLAADLEPDGVVVVAIDYFESKQPAGGAVNDFVDGASATTTDAIDSLQLGEVKLLAGLGLGR